MSTYQSFADMGSGDRDIADEDDEDNTHEAGVLIHVVPEPGRSRWSPIEDLDSFFTRMYQYHQRHGFVCMMLQQILELGQFVFVVVFSVFLFHWVNYPVLFRNDLSKINNSTKVTISDAVLPWDKAVASMGFLTWTSIIVAAVFWLLRFLKVVYDFFKYWEIKYFYNTALNICESELDNLTWHEVQRRLIAVQREHEMCIHKKDLTELDIYHRILRFENYMVSMVNKSLLPVQLKVPLYGNIVFFTRALKYNIEWLFFRGPWAPFVNSWHLKEDYKKISKRKELADALANHILWTAVINLILCPVILLWQILHSFFTYAEMIKREPGSLGSRCWSLYGRLYLRHFNELDHELNARLNRAYRPASKYMNIFTSPLMTIIAKNVGFVSGAILAVLLILTVYDEDVITVEYVLATITVLGALLAGSRVFIPDENLVWCPEQLMTAVLAHVHYLPESWRGQAHTHTVRSNFAQIFQYKAEYLMQELISPLVTPYVLYFHLRPRALDIVDFFRQFTVEVIGVGDVCSFAQMDIRRHGNPAWQPEYREPEVEPTPTESNQFVQAEDGKTELSLIHFTLTNPEWRPPADAENFVGRLRTQATKDAEMLELNTAGFSNPLCTSLHSVSSLGAGYNTFAASLLKYHLRPDGEGGTQQRTTVGQMERTNPFLNLSQPYQAYNAGSPSQSIRDELPVRGGLSRTEGPSRPERGFLLGLSQEVSMGPLGMAGGSIASCNFAVRGMADTTTSLGASVFGSGPDIALHIEPMEFTPTDMALSTLYLHEIHHRQLRKKTSQQWGEVSTWQRQQHTGTQEARADESIEAQRKNEKLPLLKNPLPKS